MPTTVWVATANIYVGAGSAYTLGYTPGNRVPDSVVAALGLATSGLVQTATIADDGTSPNWRGTDPVTQSELDAAFATLALDADNIADTATKVLMLPAERVKLGGIAAGATANSTDAQLRDRATHTGSQPASTISDSTVTGRAVLTATDAATARTAIGAGTGSSNLAIGTTGTTAAAGNHTHTPASIGAAAASHTHAIADLSATGTPSATTFLRGDGTWSTTPAAASAADATTTSKGLVQLAGDLAGTATAPTVPGLAGKAASVHTHVAADLSNSTATGRSLITATDSATARTAIGAGTASTKADVGLGNVDNTSDVNKPVSTAQQTALDSKVTRVFTKRAISTAYTLVAGDATDTVLHSIATAAVTITLPQDTAVTISQEVAIPWRAYGAGQITFAAGTGATILSRGSIFKSAGQYAEGLVTKVAANTWLVSGDLTA